MTEESKPIIYLSTCVLTDFIQKPKLAEHAARAKLIDDALASAERSECRVVTSWLSVAEVAFAEHERGASLDDEVQERLDKLWHPASPLELIEVHEMIVREAHQLLREGAAKGWSKTRGADAIHLITAKREQATKFWSPEGAMKKWEPICGFEVCEPHELQAPLPDDNLFRPDKP